MVFYAQSASTVISVRRTVGTNKKRSVTTVKITNSLKRRHIHSFNGALQHTKSCYGMYLLAFAKARAKATVSPQPETDAAHTVLYKHIYLVLIAP